MVLGTSIVRSYVSETILNLLKCRRELGDHRLEPRAAASGIDNRTDFEDFDLALDVGASLQELLTEAFFGFHHARKTS